MKYLITLLGTVLAFNAFAGQTKTDVCHSHGDGSYDLITVADPAVDSHLAHGDALIGDEVPGDPSSVFNEVCESIPAPVADPFLRARAWVDVNANGRWDEETDVLIAQLRNENGIATIDTVTVGGECARDYAFPQYFINFQVTQHVGGQITAIPDGYRVDNGSDRFLWVANDLLERYQERFITQDPSLSPVTQLIDYMEAGAGDYTEVGLESPSRPDGDESFSCTDTIGTGDDPFIQVSIFPEV